MSIVTTLAVVCLTAAGETLERPPKLTFETHVDYTSYYRKMVEKPGEPNAWDIYGKLIDAEDQLKRIEPDSRTQLGVDCNNICRSGGVWITDKNPDLHRSLIQHREFIEIFIEGCSLRNYWRPLPANAKYLHEYERMPYTQCLKIDRALLVEGWRSSRDQIGHLLASVVPILHHSEQMRSGMTLIDEMAARGHEQYALRNVLMALVRTTATQGQQCRRILKVVLPYLPATFDMDKTLLLAWAAVLDHLQYVCPNGRPDESRWKGSHGTYEGMNWQLRSESGAKQESKNVDELFSTLIRLSHMPYYDPERRRLRETLDNVEMGKDLTLTERLRQPFAFTLTNHDVAIAHRRGVVLALAIHAHREETGAWPRRLRDLKNIDAAYRIDPFSGKEFRYELRDGEPFLYSIGTDCKDDGGAPDMLWAGSANEGDWVFWPAALPYQFKVKTKDVND